MQEKLSSFITDISDLFLSPRKLAERIDEKPRVAAPIIFLAILSIVPALSVRDVTKEFVLNGLQMPPGFDGNVFVNIAIVIGIILSPLGAILNTAIESVKLFLFGKIFKGSAKFESLFSMTLYTTIITQCGAVINALLVNLSRNLYANFSLAYFLPKGTNHMIYTLVSLLNPFFIAVFIVDIIMIQVIHRYDKKSAVATVVLTFVFNILLVMLLTWANSSFSTTGYSNPYSKF